LEDVAEFLGGSTPSRAKEEYFGGGIPWVKTTDLNNGSITVTEETLTELGLKESSCKMIPGNSVLVAMYGGFNQIGRTGLLQHPSAINQALTAIIPDPARLVPEFLLEWLNFRVGYWKRLAGSSRKDPNITKGDVADFPVPYLPIDQQVDAVRLLWDWNTAIQKTEQLIAAKERRLAHFRNGLLREPERASPIKLRDVTQELTVRNGTSLGREAIMAVTKQFGMRPMRKKPSPPTSSATNGFRPARLPTTRCD
jgi:type I restriction enzyme S subunit